LIREIEIEIVNGKITQLFDMARAISEIIPVDIDTESKFSAGLRLIKAPKHIMKNYLSNNLNADEKFDTLNLSKAMHIYSNIFLNYIIESKKPFLGLF